MTPWVSCTVQTVLFYIKKHFVLHKRRCCQSIPSRCCKMDWCFKNQDFTAQAAPAAALNFARAVKFLKHAVFFTSSASYKHYAVLYHDLGWREPTVRPAAGHRRSPSNCRESPPATSEVVTSLPAISFLHAPLSSSSELHHNAPAAGAVGAVHVRRLARPSLVEARVALRPGRLVQAGARVTDVHSSFCHALASARPRRHAVPGRLD